MMHQSCLSTTTKIEFFHYMAELQSLHVGTSTSEVANWSPWSLGELFFTNLV